MADPAPGFGRRSTKPSADPVGAGSKATIHGVMAASRSSLPADAIAAGQALLDQAPWDRRLWRTLRQLYVDGGVLTLEWTAGERTRYLSPLKLALGVVSLYALLPILFGLAGEGGWAAALRDTRDELHHFGLMFTLGMGPVFVLLLAVLMVGRGARWRDHVAVTLYELSFVLSLVLVLWLLGGASQGLAALLTVPALLYFMIHVVCHLKVAYGLSWLGAVLRTWPLLAIGPMLANIALQGPYSPLH